MKTFKLFLSEQESEFDENKAVKDAEKWLENKYGKDLYTFQFIPNMKLEGQKTKTYDIVVDNRTYELHLKLFDSTGDGKMDTLGFNILPATEEPEEDEEEL